MRAYALYIFVYLTLSWAAPNNYSPFLLPFEDVFFSSEELERELLKRATCPTGYNSCSNMGNANACCTTTATCTLDENSNVACCPTRAACTGTINYVSASTTSGLVLGGTTTTTTTSSTSGFAFGSTTATATVAASTITNPYFPWVYIPTTYPNAAECTSAYSSCQTEYSSCTSSLATMGYAVTISAAGGGVTQAATGTAAAISICSSLSAKGCYGLRETQCDAFGTATGNAAPARCTGAMYGIGVGMAIGFAGAF
ncbi:MAG: hypothetical protein M1834_008146 [Cirrosporium novae-zelandiae]|nr:MAG: hypothetical protein M1834_008146 [Cirrosporium novae-zelandiae]